MRNYFKYFVYVVVIIGFSAVKADDRVSFFRALNIDNVSTISSLLAAGFDPNTLDEKGQVPLYLALREEAPRVVKALLAHPQLKVDQSNAAGETPLMMAALRGNLEAATELVNKGAAINRPGWTALHYAASGGHEAVLKLLLDKGAALEAESPNKTTPLMMASRYGSEASALLLLARGASSKARNDQGLAAGDFARLAGREAFARKLEESGR
jgi:uncharacterized protein